MLKEINLKFIWLLSYQLDDWYTISYIFFCICRSYTNCYNSSYSIKYIPHFYLLNFLFTSCKKKILFTFLHFATAQTYNIHWTYICLSSLFLFNLIYLNSGVLHIYAEASVFLVSSWSWLSQSRKHNSLIIMIFHSR